MQWVIHSFFLFKHIELTVVFTGGYDGQNFLATVEVYNPMKDVWEDGEPLISGRSGHASAVCYQNPNFNFPCRSSTSPI